MSLICKKCGHKQDDERTINYFKKKFRHVEEHDIPYYCGACLDNANDEEYIAMTEAMDNPIFNNAVEQMKKDLSSALSYDEWAGREYGENRIDVDDTARNIIEMGYYKDTDIAKKIIAEIELVNDKYPTTIGSVMIKQKLAELKTQYGIENTEK